MLNNDTLNVAGTELNNATLNLTRGWNLISYQSLDTFSINKTLKNINFSFVYGYKDKKWHSYNKGRDNSLNTINNLEPGYGYWVKVD